MNLSRKTRLLLVAIREVEPHAYDAAIFLRLAALIERNGRSDPVTRGWLLKRLTSLESEGLIESYWTDDQPTEPGFRKRSYYRLTKAGHESS